MEAKLAELAETVSLAQSGAVEEALAVARTDRGKAVINSIRQSVAGIEARSDGLAGNARLLLAGAGAPSC